MRMRRLISIALFVALAFLPLQAQRGGRGGGGGFHGGGGYHGGGAVVSRGGGYRAAPSYPVRSQVPGNHWGGYSSGAYYGRGGDRFHHHHFYGYSGYYYPSYGYVYPYAYSAYPFYDLGFYSDYSSNNDNSAYTQQLNNQVSSLSAEMQQLRDENDNLRDYIAEHNAPVAWPDRRVPPSVSAPLQPDQPVAQRPAQPEKPTVPTVLVFKDGHTLDAPNYAIVDSTIWVLTGQRASKVPLAQLDLEKTKQVNEQRGVEFVDPTAQ